MRFEYLILLIILFNIVTAMAQKRARKAREEDEARAAAAQGREPLPPADEDAFDAWEQEWEDPVEVPASSRETSRRGPPADRSTRYEQRAEERRHAVSDESRQVRDPVRKVEEMSRRVGEPGEHASKGGGFLERIARDLGIEIPGARDEERRMRREELRRRPLRAPELGKFERIKAAQPVKPVAVETSEARARPKPVRIDLSSPQKLREAVVVREILDPPVARRDRRPGQGPQLRG